MELFPSFPEPRIAAIEQQWESSAPELGQPLAVCPQLAVPIISPGTWALLGSPGHGDCAEQGKAEAVLNPSLTTSSVLKGVCRTGTHREDGQGRNQPLHDFRQGGGNPSSPRGPGKLGCRCQPGSQNALSIALPQTWDRALAPSALGSSGGLPLSVSAGEG